MMIMNPSHTHFDHDHDDVLERLEKSLYQVNALLEQGGVRLDIHTYYIHKYGK